MNQSMRTRLAGLAGAMMVVSPASHAASYYKEPTPFSPRPEEQTSKRPVNVDRFGPVGIGIELTLPAFGMKVKNVEKDSPAEATHKLKAGQIIESVNGVTLKDYDPRMILGGIITKAEATDGIVKLKVKDGPTTAAQEVTVKIPVLGAYSATWPLKCAKSDKIVRGVADYLARSGNHSYGTDLGLLFMVSTGDPKDLEVARGWVKEAAAKTKDVDLGANPHAWNNGYSGLGYCEYYLRTGDPTALPLIEKIADSARRSMYNGAWAMRGGLPFTYMMGGHVNAAGGNMLTVLLLAKECGVNVDEFTLQTTLKQFFRYAGHGNVPYGDQLPEGGFVDNGKNGNLAFQMAAAVSLTPDGENSLYAAARDISAVKGFYSTSWMLQGHTGGGIGEVWRSASMGLMYQKKPTKYREFMDHRMWLYELSRRFDGSFGIVGGDIQGTGSGRYDTPLWGTGLAFSYTIPRKTLRMTGAPATKFCKSYQLPKRPWGNAADDVFYTLTAAPDKTGKTQNVDAEKLLTDASAPTWRKLADPKISDDELLRYAHHPDQNMREQAAAEIFKQNRDKLVVDLLKDKDTRARQAGTMVLYNTFKRKPMPTERVTPEMAQLLGGIINDPNEAWWTVANAMMALSLAKPELVAPEADRLVYWLRQDEWWMRTSAMFALAKIVGDPHYNRMIMPAIGEWLAKNTRVGACVGRAWPMDEIMKQLKGAKPEVQQLSAKVLAKSYADLSTVKLTVPGGIDQTPVVDWNLDRLKQELLQLPGGRESLPTLVPAKGK